MSPCRPSIASFTIVSLPASSGIASAARFTLPLIASAMLWAPLSALMGMFAAVFASRAAIFALISVLSSPLTGMSLPST